MYAVIDEETLNNIIRASIEDYPVETRGLLYGRRKKRTYKITNSYHFRRLIQKPSSVEIKRSTKYKIKRMRLGEKEIGDFHSHVIGVLTELSDSDLNTMFPNNVYFLCGLRKANYYQNLHELRSNVLTCARGGFKIYIAAFVGRETSPIKIKVLEQ